MAVSRQRRRPPRGFRGLTYRPSRRRPSARSRIVRLHVALEAVGLEAAPARPSRQGVMYLQHASSFRGTPVRAAVGGAWRVFSSTRASMAGVSTVAVSFVARLQTVDARGEESAPPPVDIVAKHGTVASIVEYESPFASIRITRARRASSDRILRLRTRRSSSVRSSVVMSAPYGPGVPVLLQAVQATRARHFRFGFARFGQIYPCSTSPVSNVAQLETGS